MGTAGSSGFADRLNASRSVLVSSMVNRAAPSAGRVAASTDDTSAGWLSSTTIRERPGAKRP